MTAIIVACMAITLCYAQFSAQAAETDNVTYLDAAWRIAEKMCIKIEPPIDTFPADERYEILANAMAARGVDTFLGKDPYKAITLGEVRDIFASITIGEPVEYDEARDQCPADIGELYRQPGDVKISEADFAKIAACFPDCDPDVETYIPPTRPKFVPPGPEPRREQPASEI